MSTTCKRCGSILREDYLYCPFCGRGINIPPTPKKRGNGQGTAIKRGKTWTAIANVATYWDGASLKRKRISKGGFKTKKEALDYIPTLLKRADRQVDSDMTMAELYKMWHDEHEYDVVKSTMDCYRAAWKYYEPLQHYKVRDVKTSMLQKCMDDSGKGKRTQENMKTLATMLFRLAMQNDIVDRNYAEGLKPRGEKQEPRQPFTEVELQKMFNIVIDPQFDYIKCKLDYVVILCYTGFRVEEFLNLKKSDFYEDGDWAYFVGGSKTDAGRDRIVGISPRILPIVRRNLEIAKCDYIFSVDGQKLSAKKFRKLYYEALDFADVEKRVPHCCRHTFATLMKDIDAADKDKMEMIGHSSMSMTMEYTHANMDGLKKITNSL